MLEFKGKYGKAKVMIDTIDQETTKQIYEFLNHEAFTNPIAIMPDTHAGKGAVIGFTMEMTDKIIPNVVGVDINCGMLMSVFSENLLEKVSRDEIMNIVLKNVPFGTSVHSKSQIDIRNKVFWNEITLKHLDFMRSYNKRFGTNHKLMEYSDEWLVKKCDEIGMDYGRTLLSLGTVGGGNHFIELGQSQNTNKYTLTIHCGSRQFGLKIAEFWQKKAGKAQLAFLTGDDMFGYLTDMLFAAHFAEYNRKIIADIIRNKFPHDITWERQLETVHNFVDYKDFIIRKGAIRSYSGEQMIIPLNMEDGILLCEGKSNPEWNFSAPHGAGRVGSRRWAKDNLNLQEAKERMENKDIVFSNLPVDELKGAYKDPLIIEQNISETANIIDRIKSIMVTKDA